MPPEIRRPEPGLPATLHVVADLDIRIGDAHGHTDAHLGDEAGALVLDVGDPAVLRRSFSRPRLALRAPGGTSYGLSIVPPVRVRSAGRDLAHVYVGPEGTTRVQPTAAGMVVAAKLAPVAQRASALAVSASVVIALLVVVSRWRSSRGPGSATTAARRRGHGGR